MRRNRKVKETTADKEELLQINIDIDSDGCVGKKYERRKKEQRNQAGSEGDTLNE